MTSCPSADVLQRFLGDQLGDREEGPLAAHVEQCPTCQEKLEQLTQVTPQVRLHIPTPLEGSAELPAPLRERLQHLARASSWRGLAPDTRTHDLTLCHAGSPPTPARTWPAVPGYDILGELGRGGMGVVYQARQLGFNRVVALKMILDGPHASAEQRARFQREAEAVAALQHPNIVQVYDVGEYAGRPFFSMEYVADGSLAARLTGTPTDSNAAAELIRTLAAAVQTAHARGIVHRDLKPANILLQRTNHGTHGRHGKEEREETQGEIAAASFPCLPCVPWFSPKIADFGLAKHLPPPDAATADGMTHSGAILGSPSYMAPEQASGRGQTAGPAADVYALGAILYELLTGRPPFKGATPLDTLMQVTHEEPIPPRRLVPTVPRDLETICLKCLEKTPARRYATAGALADDLGLFLAGESIVARPAAAWERAFKWAKRRPAAAALIAISVLALIGLTLAWQRAEKQRSRALEHLNQSVSITIDQLVLLRKTSSASHPDVVYHQEMASCQAITFFEGVLAEDHPADERHRQLRGRVHNGLGMAFLVVGKPARAEEQYLQAETLQKALVTDFPDKLEYRVDLALTYHGLGDALTVQARAEDAQAAYGKAVELFATLPSDHPRLALHVTMLANQLFNRGKLQESLPWQSRLIQQLTVREAAAATPKERAAVRAALTPAHVTRAISLMRLNKPAESFADWDRACELEPTQPPVRWRAFRSWALALNGQHARAIAEMDQLTAQGLLAGPALLEEGIGTALAYVAANTYSECWEMVLKDDKLPTVERGQLAESYLRRYIDFLEKARAAGFFKNERYRQMLLKQAEVPVLRDREDFRALLKSVGE